MIIKSLSRKSNPGQLIKYATRYIIRDSDKKASQDYMKVLIKHNLRSSSTVDEFINDFKSNESYRIYKRKDSVVLFHTILSFAPGDKKKVSILVLKDLAKKFIDLRAPNCLNLAIGHLEKQHTHIHVLTSGVQVNGKSSRVSKHAFSNILQQLEEYQQAKYPELVHSKNNHSSVKTSDRLRFKEHLSKSRKSNTLRLHTHIENGINHARSYDDFIQRISKDGCEPYYRNGKIQGIVSDGKKYRLSKLGVDIETVKNLEEKNDMIERSQIATELSAIREKASLNKSKETAIKDQEECKDGNIKNELDSIKSIRSKIRFSEELEKTFEQTTN